MATGSARGNRHRCGAVPTQGASVAGPPRRLRNRLPLRSYFFFWLTLQQSDLLDARGVGWAPSGNLWIVFESIMDEAPLVGVHGLELKRAAGDAHAFRQLAHALHDPIFTHGTIMFAIDDDFFRVLVSGLQ